MTCPQVSPAPLPIEERKRKSPSTEEYVDPLLAAMEKVAKAAEPNRCVLFLGPPPEGIVGYPAPVPIELCNSNGNFVGDGDEIPFNFNGKPVVGTICHRPKTPDGQIFSTLAARLMHEVKIAEQNGLVPVGTGRKIQKLERQLPPKTSHYTRSQRTACH